MIIIHYLTSVLWFPLCLIGNIISDIGHGIWCIGAWIYDLTL